MRWEASNPRANLGEFPKLGPSSAQGLGPKTWDIQVGDNDHPKGYYQMYGFGHEI